MNRAATTFFLPDARVIGLVSVAADGNNLYIADTSNNRVQEVPAASGTQWASR